MNLFNWIREGVRQAVLFGVSDAVGELGTTPNGEDMNHRILQLLRTAPQQDASALGSPLATPAVTSAASNGAIGGPAGQTRRKRLGRTLGDIQATLEKTS